MAHFQYSGRDSSGGRVSGTIDAGTADEVATELFGQNVTPIDIRQVARKRATTRKPKAKENASTVENINAFLAKKRVETDDLIMFARQMHSLTRAGLPLDRAMKGLEASLINPLFKSVLQDVIDGLENGQGLATAMGRHPNIFSDLFLSLIHVGENTGRLDLAFKEVGRYLELEKNTRKQVKSATRYPMFVIAAMIAALAVITVFVIPVFSQTFERLGADLPWQTVVLINTSDFVVSYWPFILGAAVGGFFWFRYWIGTERGRLSWDRRKLRFPLAGPVFEKVALARFSRTLAMVLKAGLPIVQGLNVVAGAVGNTYVARNVNRMRENVERGESLHRTAVNSKMFTPLVLQMISVGEETGAVDELLSEVAEFYDAEVEYELKQMSDAIEPILISFIAGLVLILALGVFLPIWDLNTAVNQ
ncbi:MAG: MSHA fimbrial biogenesis protein MshG [Pseudohongiellaceae bacterium]